jgi:DNA-binding PadR family transcriptional regulator
MLTKLEDQILLAVMQLKDQAYGIKVYQHLEEVTKNKLAIGVVYFALDRMTKRGLLDSYKGKPTPVRGGMRKKYYRITEAGISALTESKKAYDLLWLGFSPGVAKPE